MYIDANKWANIAAETKAGIAKWNAEATKYGRPDVFRFVMDNYGRFEVITTIHEASSFYPEAKALAREIETGEVRRTKVTKKRDRLRFSAHTPDPKGWKGLADKPADVIVKKLKLLGFTMFISSPVTEVRIAGPAATETK